MTAQVISMKDFESSKEYAVMTDDDYFELFIEEFESHLFDLAMQMKVISNKETVMNVLDAAILAIDMEPDCLSVWQFFADMDESEFA